MDSCVAISIRAERLPKYFACLLVDHGEDIPSAMISVGHDLPLNGPKLDPSSSPKHLYGLFPWPAFLFDVGLRYLDNFVPCHNHFVFARRQYGKKDFPITVPVLSSIMM